MLCSVGGGIYGIYDWICHPIYVVPPIAVDRRPSGEGSRQKKGLTAFTGSPKSTLVRSYFSAEVAGSRRASRSSIHAQTSL
jgi:hypothetical protein